MADVTDSIVSIIPVAIAGGIAMRFLDYLPEPRQPRRVVRKNRSYPRRRAKLASRLGNFNNVNY